MTAPEARCVVYTDAMYERAIILLVSCVGLGSSVGCVTKAKYVALSNQHDATAKQLLEEREQFAKAKAQSDDRIVTLTEALEEQREQVDVYARQISSLQATMAARQAEIAALEQSVDASKRELALVITRRARLKESLDRVTTALSELASRKLEAERRVAEYRDMLGRFAALIDAGTLDVRVVDGRMVLTLPMDILFASGRTNLTPPGEEALAEVGAVLATIPNKQFQVEGHTDNVPIHTARFPSNWELGSGRALTVLRTIERAGVPPQQLSAATFSEYQPRVENDNPDRRQLNRRIEIVILPDLSGLPGYDELKNIAGGQRS